MGWKSFIASVIGNLAWPLVTIIVFFLLRKQINNLFDQVEYLKGMGVELDFKKVKEHENDIKKDTLVEDFSNVEFSPAISSLEDQISESLETDPSVAILLAWSAIETALTEATIRLLDSSDDRFSSSITHNIKIIERNKFITERQAFLLNEMRLLRNKVIHNRNKLITVSREQAADYANTALTLVDVLNRIEGSMKIFVTPNGEWIELPPNFEIHSNHTYGKSLWVYSYIQLINTGLTAGVGPWKGSRVTTQGNYSCYGIDIEMVTPRGSKVINELLINLDLVSPEILTKNASDIVTYDAILKIVTFNLGKSIFKYRII